MNLVELLETLWHTKVGLFTLMSGFLTMGLVEEEKKYSTSFVSQKEQYGTILWLTFFFLILSKKSYS